MPTAPITLTPVGGPPYAVVSGHLVMLYKGAWILDVELSADSVQTFGVPSGKCVVVFGGMPMTGTIDPNSSGAFGPTARVRVVAGANGWSTYPTSTVLPTNDFHSDAGLSSTLVYQAVGAAVGETVVDLAPATLGLDYVVSRTDPAMSIFGDDPWFVDTLGITNHGPRLPAVADLSLVIRDFDPVEQKVTFACDTLLLPGTILVDPRFGVGSTYTVANVEQIFDGQGSTGWAWANTSPVSVIADDLKAATLYWTRASYLRVYRYNLVLYQGDGPGGGPTRMALQAVTPTVGVPDIITPIAPWSGVAGVVSMLAPGQQVLVVFENADPTLPRVIGYSLLATGGQPLGLPLSTQVDASVELEVGITCPVVKVGEQAVTVDVGALSTVALALAGGKDFLVLATPYAALLSALSTFSGTVSTITPPTTLPEVVTAFGTLLTAATTLSSALGSLPPAPTTITKAT
jgi:hypothetical protein